jgi:signal transduction histidine kinase/ligand-binding sensor domain-containing protein/DNA-binding NarL/FixJ family response regulator
VLVGLLLALGIRAAGAGEPAFTVRSWMPTDGLPTSTVHDIVQTPDGYLWVATTGGLSRFDGVRFHTYGTADGLPSSRFTALLVMRDGTLWAATEDGWLCHWDGTRFSSSDTRQRLSEATIVEAADGSLVGCSAARLWRFRAGRMEVVPDSVDDWHSRFVLDGHGDAWVTATDGAPGRIAGKTIVRLGPGSRWDRPSGRWIRDERDGGIVFYRPIGPDAELLDPAMRRVALLAGAGEELPELIDRQGRLWTTTRNGIVARDAESGLERQRYRLGLTERPFRVRPDRDGNLWVCTQTQGLIRIAPSPLRLLRPENHPAAIEILYLNGTSDGGVLAIDLEGRAWRAGDDALLPTTLGPHGQGSRAPWLGVGATRYRTTGAGLEVSDGSEVGKVPILGATGQTLVVDPNRPGTIYLLWKDEVRRIDATATPPRVDVVFAPPQEVRDLFVDRQDRLWIATMVGLWRIAPGDTVRYTRSEGLPVDHVRQIHEDEDGTMWFGTYGGGLVRWRNGRFATLDHRHGLIEDVVSVVLEDDSDHLWLAGNHGIQRLSRQQANDCLDGRRARVDVVAYGREAGLRNPEGSGRKGLRTPDGRLWFPTFDGLAVVDPAVARTLTGSPPVARIEAIAIDGRESSRTTHDVTVPAGTPRFEVRYTGFDLRAAEQLRFQYRLEGVDRDWVDAGTARTATYTTVPPGRHRFRVQVVNAAGIASVQEDAVTIQVLPRFWQTPWFAVLAALGLLAAIGAGLRWRERQLQGRAAELQRAVDARTAELASQKGRTEDALATVEEQAHRLTALDRARSRFFASISHEFRTPLTLIHGPLHDVRAGEHGPLHADATEQIDIALDSAQRLQRLVDQLLDAARAEAGELRVVRRPGDLVAFLTRMVDALAPLADRKRITFTWRLPSEPAAVAFDSEAMEKVFANLLGNAFKFTPAGGNVTLSAEVVRGDAPAIEVAVADDGPGIAAEDLPHVFKRFYRAERSITRVQPGTGLGLALASDVIEQHGGSIRVESHEGRGSTFTVRLALLTSDASAEVPVVADLDRAELAALTDEIRVETNGGPEPEAGVPPPSDADTLPIVLVVDDHAAVRAYVARHLRRRYRVVEAADGREALASMRREVPDLVVSDVTMPELDGHGLVRAIREDPDLDFVPVLLLTAAASPESRIAGLEGGADDYLTKPFVIRELLARISQALESRRRLRERVARAAAAAAVYGASPAPHEAPEVEGTMLPAAGRAASAIDTAFVRRLREVIESRMGDEDFDVERLAEAMGMGRTLLFQRVGELLDQTPMTLVMNHRLERAAQLLRGDDGGVGEVAYAVGFRSVSHFTRRFRDRYGVTPSAWKRGDEAVAASSPSTADA